MDTMVRAAHDHTVKATVMDSQWESKEGASVAPNRYQLRISGGAVQVTLDSETKNQKAVEAEPVPKASGEPAGAFDILLDGVESRTSSRRGA